jgi:hypothetical protein
MSVEASAGSGSRQLSDASLEVGSAPISKQSAMPHDRTRAMKIDRASRNAETLTNYSGDFGQSSLHLDSCRPPPHQL